MWSEQAENERTRILMSLNVYICFPLLTGHKKIEFSHNRNPFQFNIRFIFISVWIGWPAFLPLSHVGIFIQCVHCARIDVVRYEILHFHFDFDFVYDNKLISLHTSHTVVLLIQTINFLNHWHDRVVQLPPPNRIISLALVSIFKKCPYEYLTNLLSYTQ